jgi:two-component system chemotaxis sensor kinase CheA
VDQQFESWVSSKIDALSTDLILNPHAAPSREQWLSWLKDVSVAASAGGRTAVASLAEELIRNSEADVGGGLERLRVALDNANTPASIPAIAEDPELIAEFVTESREHLESIEAQLLVLERESANAEAIHSVFRSFHTIKGLAGFLALPEIQEVAHEVETILDRARENALQITPAVIDVVLESKDYVARWLKHLDQDPSAPTLAELRNRSALVTRIHALLEGGTASADAPAPAAESQELPEPGSEKSAKATARKGSGRAVKVDTEKLDYLVDMVGEMVIAQSLVRHDPELKAAQNPRLARNLGQLARITEEVQRTAMAMRMVPIGPLFQKMARLVRDLARNSGKKVEFECFGEDVELDRNIVEELADPLMHMTRNALDHGIEPPADRVAQGKPATASFTLRASHRSGHIVIEIIDNGRGINREKVLAKARSQGLVNAGASISDSEVLNLIFHPGFSTADQISNVSGRGVGMDVVKKQIQKLRGAIDILSEQGKGTTFTLKVPLTLAIIDGLLVGVGQERYIIPLASVKELLRPTEGALSTVEGKAEVVVIRDQILPVMRLADRLGIRPASTNPLDGVLVVVEVDGRSLCLVVDQLMEKQEVVIKSLGSVFERVAGVAGGAILGDGQIGLLLDIRGLLGARGEL